MEYIADHKKSGKNRKQDKIFPTGILDIIEADYPERFAVLQEDSARIKKLFTDEEWIDILTKSRNSYKNHIKQLKNKRRFEGFPPSKI